MRLVSLKLTNFKGARDLTVIANGEDLDVFADNGVGKTTIFDAHLFLLFGKDSLNRSDFEIKTIDKATGQPIHKLSHEVEGVYVLANGDEVTLKHCYVEEWTRPRGSAKETFSGHVHLFYVDGVRKDKREYQDFVARVCDEKKFRLLSDPAYFCGQLKWEDRRRMLVELVGDVSDEAVIASSDKFKALPAILGRHKADDMKAVLAAKRKTLNEELRTLPTRIDEARRVAGEAFDGQVQDTAAADKKVADLQAKLAAARNGGAVTQLRIELGGVAAKMQERETQLKKEAGSGYDVAQERVRAAQQALSEAQGLVARAASRVEVSSATVARIDDELNRLRAELAEIKARTFVSTVTDTCPTCMRSLPPADVEAANAKALSDFNAKQGTEIEANIAKGRAAKQAWAEAEATLNEWRENLAAAEEGLLVAETGLATAKQEAAKLERPQIDLATDAEYSALVQQKAGLESKIANEGTASAEAVHQVEQELESARAELAELAQANARVEAAQSARDRVGELEAQEKRVSEQFEEVEGQIFLIEEFTRAKARLLTDRINAEFGIVSFKLFDEQINGGLAECCEAMVGGVPYGSLNHGSRVNAGLDIIDTLGRSLGFTPVIFIDGAESVTSIRPTAAQQIRLVVSANDKALRFEGAKKLQKAS